MVAQETSMLKAGVLKLSSTDILIILGGEGAPAPAAALASTPREPQQPPHSCDYQNGLGMLPNVP